MNTQNLIYEYDREADAIFIEVENYEPAETIQLNDEVIMDFNKKGEFIALEILSLSHVLNTSKKSLENINNVDLIVKGTDYQLFVCAIFTLVKENHDEIKVTNASTINDVNIPLNEIIATA